MPAPSPPSQNCSMLYLPSKVGHNFAVVQAGYFDRCRGTVEGVHVKSYEAPKILMLTAATAFVVISVIYLH